uniref:Ig-like domain-containing protein n=1 Tax=Hucho hucho TaxID=62062 RepID=A0A4W5NY77_9TELE
WIALFTTMSLQNSTKISEQVMKKEIVYGEVESYTEIKASHTQMVMTEGQSLTPRANIPGASDIRWILNGMELANSEDYRYGVSGNNHKMFIKKVSQYEQGVITCEAKTKHGLVKCQFDTTVTEAQSDASSFIVQPRSQNVNEGQNIKFTCEIAGEPAPEIECLKDNIMKHKLIFYSPSLLTGIYDLKQETELFKKCIILTALVEEPAKIVIKEQSAGAASMHSDSFSATSVHMAGASMTQEGSFQSQFESMSAASVSAITSESMVSMSSSSMTEMMSSHAISTHGSSMSALIHGGGKGEMHFPLPYSDISIEPRKTLSVSCGFSGHPTPEIEWARSGKQCDEESDRFHIEATEDLTTLVIPCVKENDAGAYTLKLSNKLGSAMATVNIHIRSSTSLQKQCHL